MDGAFVDAEFKVDAVDARVHVCEVYGCPLADPSDGAWRFFSPVKPLERCRQDDAFERVVVEHFALGLGDAFDGAKTLEVRCAHTGDDGDIRFGQAAEHGDFSRSAGPHFEDGDVVVRREPHHRHGQSDVVVEIARRFEHAVIFGRQKGRQKFFCRRFSVGPRDGIDLKRRVLRAPNIENGGGQAAKGFEYVVDDKGRHFLGNGERLRVCAVDDDAPALGVEHLWQEIMRVKTLTFEGQKHLISGHASTVRRNSSIASVWMGMEDLRVHRRRNPPFVHRFKNRGKSLFVHESSPKTEPRDKKIARRRRMVASFYPSHGKSEL